MCFPKPPAPPKIADPVAPMQAAPPPQAPLAPESAPGAYQSSRSAATARKRLRIDLSAPSAAAPGAGLRIPA